MCIKIINKYFTQQNLIFKIIIIINNIKQINIHNSLYINRLILKINIKINKLKILYIKFYKKYKYKQFYT